MKQRSEVEEAGSAGVTMRFESAEDVATMYRPVMRALAAAIGPACEVVLHDLSGSDLDLDHTIVAIENGHVTGRTVGGPSSSLGAEVIHNQGAEHDAYGYPGFTSDGRQLRCSSTYFRNAEGSIIAALCINYDLSAMKQAKELLESLLPEQESKEAPSEFFGQDLVSVMDTMVSEAIAAIGKPVNRMTREDRVAVIRRLDKQGALQMRKGMEHIATRLNVSRVTTYSYLEEARGDAV